jgi:DNA-binding transcriptional ArsR family regulator
MVDLDRTLSALSDPTRRRVIEILRQKPRRAGELADALSASKPAMSRHLRVLRKSGLVETYGEDDARVRMYALAPAPLTELRHWLEEIDRFWTHQLDSFANHVARTRGKKR